MTDPTGRERRKHPRVALGTPVIVIHQGDVRAYPVRDVSAGGAFLLGAPAPPSESPLRVELDAGPGKRFTINARVVRDETSAADVRARGFAIRFEAPGELLERVAEALRARAGSDCTRPDSRS